MTFDATDVEKELHQYYRAETQEEFRRRVESVADLERALKFAFGVSRTQQKSRHHLQPAARVRAVLRLRSPLESMSTDKDPILLVFGRLGPVGAGAALNLEEQRVLLKRICMSLNLLPAQFLEKKIAPFNSFNVRPGGLHLLWSRPPTWQASDGLIGRMKGFLFIHGDDMKLSSERKLEGAALTEESWKVIGRWKQAAVILPMTPSSGFGSQRAESALPTEIDPSYLRMNLVLEKVPEAQAADSTGYEEWAITDPTPKEKESPCIALEAGGAVQLGRNRKIQLGPGVPLMEITTPTSDIDTVVLVSDVKRSVYMKRVQKVGMGSVGIFEGQCMVVLTPVLLTQNSSFNALDFNRYAMVQEFKR
ncbi:hypothetical protein FOZ60_011022, partial [Perkinsus olseni]